MDWGELKDFLNEKVDKYNQPDFIPQDPLQFPHRFDKLQDIEISGFIAASLAWGNRKMIINSVEKVLSFMDHAPYDFIMNHTERDLNEIPHFVHRTFNRDDLLFFLSALQGIYKNHESLEELFLPEKGEVDLFNSISRFRTFLMKADESNRCGKHISNPEKGSASKRIHMFLRWMVRNDARNVDLGVWKNINPSYLSCPLDVHTGNVGRKLGFITRKANDRKSVNELDSNLRKLDPNDPVKYDFALFGLGAIEGWK